MEVGFEVLPAVANEFGGLFLLDYNLLQVNDLSMAENDSGVVRKCGLSILLARRRVSVRTQTEKLWIRVSSRLGE